MTDDKTKHPISTLVGALILIIEVAIFSVLFFAVSWQVKSELFFSIPFIKKDANLNVNEVTNANTNNSNLGVYNNTKYQYTVTLPTGWRANTDEFCSMDNVGFGQDEPGEKYQCPPDGGGWTYNISAIQNTTIAAAQEDIVTKNHPEAKVVDDTISGKSAKHYLYTFTSEYLGGTFTQEGYLVSNGSTVFDIWTQQDGSVSEYDSAFDQFAKSFTFTDEAGGWETYTNETHVFSFKYPKEFVVDRSVSDSVSFVGSQSCLDQKNALPKEWDQPYAFPGCHFMSVSVQGNKITREGVDISTSTVKMGNLDAEKTDGLETESAGYLLIQAQNKSNWYLLQDLYHVDIRNTVNSLLDLVASTFQFTD